MQFKKIILSLALLALVSLMGTACAMAGNSQHIFYKVTVTVTTPEGEKTGYAVREAGRYSEVRILPEQGGVTYNLVKGEAVVIDLGKRGILFAAMGGENEAEGIFRVFSDKGKESSAVVPLEQFRIYPQLVHFKDINDPMTIEKAAIIKIEGGQPYGPFITGGHVTSIHLDENIFGKGVDLKNVKIELTNEPVTRGIEKLLPWLPERKKVGGDLGARPEKSNEDPSKTFLTGNEFKAGR